MRIWISSVIYPKQERIRTGGSSKSMPFLCTLAPSRCLEMELMLTKSAHNYKLYMQVHRKRGASRKHHIRIYTSMPEDIFCALADGLASFPSFPSLPAENLSSCMHDKGSLLLQIRSLKDAGDNRP